MSEEKQSLQSKLKTRFVVIPEITPEQIKKRLESPP